MRDLLFLAHRVPYPPDRGDKIRAFHLLVHLARRYRVHLLAFADDPRDLGHGDALAALTASATILPRTKPRWRAGVEALVGGRPVSLSAFDDPAMRRAVAGAFANPLLDAVFVFSGQMAQYLPDTVGAPVVMDFCDMDSAKFHSYADRGTWPMAVMMRREGERLQAFETEVAARVDASLFVSSAEATLFRNRTRATRLHVVENGIDTDRFDPDGAFDRISADPDMLLFTGQMDYPPNIDAVTWFADTVLPAVRQHRPAAQFVICGRSPPPAVIALGQRDGVTVTGEVADVRGWLASCAVAVAPLRVARGIQNKVLEAMAMARPVLASNAAAEGIDHAGTVRTASGADAWTAALLDLLGDPAGAGAMGRLAREQVQRRYGWDARLAPLDALLDPVAAEAA